MSPAYNFKISSLLRIFILTLEAIFPQLKGSIADLIGYIFIRFIFAILTGPKYASYTCFVSFRTSITTVTQWNLQ